MNDRNDSAGRKLTPAQKHIEWARSLSNEQMVALLQDALVRCRAQHPNTHEVVLTEQVVHELKNRLTQYDKVMGPLDDGDDDG